MEELALMLCTLISWAAKDVCFVLPPPLLQHA
ncbi:hypothetical protein BS78_06G257000 [Paspalum vaginatum]|nr:hypothetical protein BS78_06G257000 [Paspalum vaginatum]